MLINVEFTLEKAVYEALSEFAENMGIPISKAVEILLVEMIGSRKACVEYD